MTFDLGSALEDLSKSMNIVSNEPLNVTNHALPPPPPPTLPYTVSKNESYIPESGTPPRSWKRVSANVPHPLVVLWTESPCPQQAINHTTAFVLNTSGDVLVKVERTGTVMDWGGAVAVQMQPRDCRNGEGYAFLGLLTCCGFHSTFAPINKRYDKRGYG